MRSPTGWAVTRALTRWDETVVLSTKEVTVTITLSRGEAKPSQASTRDAHPLLSTLRETVDAVSELDPDLLHSHTSAGRAVVALAGAARAAAAALGVERGTVLRTAPGVVVVRDLVAAVSLLELAASRRGGTLDPLALQQVTGRVSAAYGRLVLSLPALT